jgi:hypothetical protein
MKHKNKIIAIVMIFLIVLTVQVPEASAQFGAIGKVFDSVGKLFNGVANWIDDVATGRIDAGEAIGKVVGGVITGVLTGTYNGLENSIESILRGTEFDVAYRTAKNKIRVSIDEKYKLESLVQEMDDLGSDFSKLQQEIVQAGCEEAGNVDFGVAAETQQIPEVGKKPNGADCLTGPECQSGRCENGKCVPKPTAGPTREELAKYNDALAKYKQAKTDVIGGEISKGEFKKINKEFRAIQKELNTKYKTSKY